MKSDLVFFSNAHDNPQEGGMARNFAFYNEMQKRGAEIHNYTSLHFVHRVRYVIVNVLKLLSLKGKKILILQTVLLKYVFPFALFRYTWFRKFAGYVIRKITTYNKLYIEINDLIYEQAHDMDLGGEATSLVYQRFIFSQTDVHFIFASQLLADHASEKYGVKNEFTQTVLNGAPQLMSKQEMVPFPNGTDRLIFLYAGTLNKGREVDKIISIFGNHERADLILIGIGGEWINDLPYNNINYLGSFPEQDAMQIVAMADVGIIPYNADKLYYNICYPTKVSFYFTAGIPMLSTPLRETQRALINYPDAAFFVPIGEWDTFITHLTKHEVLEAKKMMKKVKNDFTWWQLLSGLKM